MDGLIGTLVFLLPGVLAYFWLQAFGLNPTTKHSSVELTAISALLWLPISITTLNIYNHIWNPIWSANDLKMASENLNFLATFYFLSIIVSFLFSVLWAKWLYLVPRELINSVRKWRGLAPFSDKSSVWDEVFLNNDPQVVEIGKIDNPDEKIIGEIKKASRTFETERLCLRDIELYTQLVSNHEIQVDQIFCDVKSGMYVKVFNNKSLEKAAKNSSAEV